MKFLSLALLSFPFLSQALPNGYNWGCLKGNVSSSLPFCDHTLDIKFRVDDLVSRLTLDEKLGFLGSDNSTHVGSCGCMNKGVDRLGIDKYMNLVETNSAVASACMGEKMCATEFPGPTNLGATFNKTVWRRKGEILSDEMRAFNNLNGFRTGDGLSLIGLTGFGPNINIARDPRFGRISELPSEDPLLSGTYGVEYVKGMQEGKKEDPRYFKMIAGLKHYAAYSVEEHRESRMFNISQFDLFDTYLRQYKMAFSADQGNAQAVMCSYAGVNGIPACANDYLMNKVMRELWGRDDALVVSDCGALVNMESDHYASNSVDVAMKSFNAGLDVDMGDSYYVPRSEGSNGGLEDAIAQNLVTIERVDASVKRILEKRFKTGLFDPIEGQVYMTYGLEKINATEHHEFVLDSALQSLILLKNDAETLPFPIPSTFSNSRYPNAVANNNFRNSNLKVAVVGPQAFAQRDFFEDYVGDQVCNTGGYACVRTLGEVVSTLYGSEYVTVSKGVDLDSTDTSGIQAALDAVKAADLVILAIGDGNTQEHEGKDRTSITLPGLQESFAAQVLALNKRTVVVLVNGGTIGIDKLVDSSPAIIEAFNPGMRSAEAIFYAIFGLENRWGRLPVTAYKADIIDQLDMYDFNMTGGVGRTYRYFQGEPLFAFGSGLSYTNFKHSCESKQLNSLSLEIICNVENKGSRKGDDVLMVFHRQSLSNMKHPVPLKTLVAFDRLSIEPKQKKIVTFKLDTESFSLTNENGDRVVYYGKHTFDVFDGTNTFSLDLQISEGHAAQVQIY